MSKEFYGFYIVSTFISIVLFAYIITYLRKLETIGCKCALDWKRNLILFFAFYTIITLTIDIVLLATNHPPLILFVNLLAPIHILLSIIFVIVTLKYTHQLKQSNCNCSEDIGRSILYIVALIDATIFALVGILILIRLFTIAFSTTKIK